MTISLSMLDADVLEATTDLPSACTIDGVTYACLADDLAAGGVVQDIGAFEDVSVVLILRTALFTAAGKSLPKTGSLVTYGGNVYGIDDSGPVKSVDGKTVTIRLEAKAKTAR